MTGLMAGKRGLIMGLANDKSLAWGIAQKLAEQGAELAFSYQGEALKKRVGPTTSDASAGSYAKGQTFRVQCFTDSGQKWYLTSASRWVAAKYVKTSSEVRYCSNV